jgi:TetR/AcrR family transcriptional repressor of mexJK operon
VNRKQSLLEIGKIEIPAACAMGSRRGRPCLMDEPERRRLLIDAAESVFLEVGYRAAGTSDIARRAGMSKKTLYGLFDSKESLFAAMIAARRKSMEPDQIDEAVCADVAAIERILCRYIGRLARFILAPRQAALYRLVIAEAHRAPELSRAFYREGPEKARAPLAEWLHSLHQRGALSVSDPGNAAAMLISMAIAQLHMRLLMVGDGGSINESTIDGCVSQAVGVFLRGTAVNKMAGQERG